MQKKLRVLWKDRFWPLWKRKWIVFTSLGFLLSLTLAVLFVYGRMVVKGEEARALSAGAAYLKALEQKDMTEIERKVKDVEREARASAIAKGELSIWAQFGDYAIFGDSRTVGFSFYGFLEPGRILADAGLTIGDIPAYLDQLLALNPSSLFLCTGLNDVSIGFWNTPEEYVSAYEERIQDLRMKLPDTHIYINSILPAKDPAFAKAEVWRRIPEYNASLQRWCEEKGYSYIDNTSVFDAHQDLYDPDGIHFQKDFYPYWAANMLAEVELS